MLDKLSDLGIATPVVRVGWPDRFIEHGKLEALRAKYGISVEAAMEKVRPFPGVAKALRLESRERSPG